MLAAWVLTLVIACGGNEIPGVSDPTRRDRPDENPILVEITQQIGLPGDSVEWTAGTYYYPEITGTGLAFIDFDDDGDLDLLHVRSPPPGQQDSPAPNRLYRQEPDGNFVDVTSEAGLGDEGYGQGVAVGDVDNDGDLDVYFTNFGRDSLYLNNGDATFVDATSEAGFDAELWSTSAAFCDYDRDGDLDLYVTHYVDYSYPKSCAAGGKPEYCGPSSFAGEPDQLFRNEGDGHFRDVTRELGITLPRRGEAAKGLGVICVDLTHDDWPDIYVANDSELNQLWVNRNGTSFVDEAVMRGVAVNRFGTPEGSMGVVVGDADGDGNLDLFMTHIAQETNTFYSGSSGSLFSDRTVEAGAGLHDLSLTGFGCGLLDYDLDGDLDLAVVNGRVRRGKPLAGAALDAFWNPYAEPDLLFRNGGEGRLENVTASSGQYGERLEVGRGLAVGDLDNDGDPDIAVTTGANVLRVYRNEASHQGSRWLTIRAMTGRRDAIGATVTVTAGSRRRTGLVLPATGYLSSNDFRIQFGLGDAARVDGIEVRWPDGTKERFDGGDAGQLRTLQQGAGVPM